jgi:hypothetical protein
VQLIIIGTSQKIESLPWWNFEYFIYTFKDVPVLTGNFVSNNDLIILGNGNIDNVIDYNWGDVKIKAKLKPEYYELLKGNKPEYIDSYFEDSYKDEFPLLAERNCTVKEPFTLYSDINKKSKPAAKLNKSDNVSLTALKFQKLKNINQDGEDYNIIIWYKFRTEKAVTGWTQEGDTKTDLNK